MACGPTNPFDKITAILSAVSNSDLVRLLE